MRQGTLSPHIASLVEKINRNNPDEKDEITLLIAGNIAQGKSCLYNALNNYEPENPNFSSVEGEESVTKGFKLTTYEPNCLTIHVVDLQGIEDTKIHEGYAILLQFIANSSYKNPLLLWCNKAGNRFTDDFLISFLPRLELLLPVIVVRTYAFEKSGNITGDLPEVILQGIRIIAKEILTDGSLVAPKGMEELLNKIVEKRDQTKVKYIDLTKDKTKKRVLSGLIIGTAAVGVAAMTFFNPCPVILEDAILCAVEVAMIGGIFAVYKEYAPTQCKYSTKQMVEKIIHAIAAPALHAVTVEFVFVFGLFKIPKIVPFVGNVLSCVCASILTIILGIITLKVVEEAEHQRLFFNEDALLESIVSNLKSIVTNVAKKLKNKKKINTVEVMQVTQDAVFSA